MYWTFYSQDQNTASANLENILKSFQALVDVIIPRTPELAKEYGIIQYYGALDAFIDEYMLLSLQNLPDPLAGYAIDLLDTALQLIQSEGYPSPEQETYRFFWEASPEERLQALERIRLAVIYLTDQSNPSAGQLNRYAEQPGILQDNPDMILNIYSFLMRYPMLGYYSEWFGYGSTRLYPPEQRQLEYYPFSWEQIDYPGPALGYHALRNTI